MSRKSPPSKGLGRTFHSYLRCLEVCEHNLSHPDRTKQMDLRTISTIAQQVMGDPLYDGDEKAQGNFLSALLWRWANDAMILRESFKFRSEWNPIRSLAGSLGEAQAEFETRPPFKTCAFVIDHMLLRGDKSGDKYTVNQCVLLVDTRTIGREEESFLKGDWYAENGLVDSGDEFLSISLYFEGIDKDLEDTGVGGGLVPLEIHMLPDSNCVKPNYTWATPANTPAGQHEFIEALGQLMEEMYVCFICALAARYAERRTVPGIKPMTETAARPKRESKQRPFYEHTLVRIDPTMEPELLAAAGSRGGGRKRLHPVRGFYRHFKQPIKHGPNQGKTRIWLEESWRGDKNLGVVTHDYEVVTEDETDDD